MISQKVGMEDTYPLFSQIYRKLHDNEHTLADRVGREK